MAELSWSRLAIGDVQRLYRFLEQSDLKVAMRAVETIKRSVDRLSRFPEIGRPARKKDARIRDLVIPVGNSGYTARYSYDGEHFVIVLVRHQREFL